MVNIGDLRASYERISSYLVETPILSSDNLNKKFEANIFLSEIKFAQNSIKLFVMMID